jgi:hypothetical protein
MRVQIPAYTDMWMRGARFGEVVKITRSKIRSKRVALLTKHLHESDREIAHVKLDLTGKVVRVVLADCSVL